MIRLHGAGVGRHGWGMMRGVCGVTGPGLRAGWVLAGAALVLAGCGGGRRAYDGSDPNAAAAGLAGAPGRYYPPPGPRSDPWGPYVEAAAARFGLQAQWIRAVMRQESGGQQQAVSPVGAMGLMQLMPATYAALRTRYGLGDDPFEPRDNIMAGSAYLREMHDRYGAPGFLAAYNAGPQRLDAYLANGDPLPDETVGYLSAIAPALGPGTVLSGPLAVYAGGGAQGGVQAGVAPSQRSLAAGCDPDAAFDPERPCRALERAAAAAASPVAGAAPVGGVALGAEGAGPVVAAGGWAVQVGAFASAELARGMAARAASEVPELAGAMVATPATAPFGGRVLYRARLVALSADTASLACLRLNARQLPCIVVRPGAAA